MRVLVIFFYPKVWYFSGLTTASRTMPWLVKTLPMEGLFFLFDLLSRKRGHLRFLRSKLGGGEEKSDMMIWWGCTSSLWETTSRWVGWVERTKLRYLVCVFFYISRFIRDIINKYK